MKIIQLSLILLTLSNFSLRAQILSSTFELRYFTDDPKANGETDFKGESEWMDTDQRIRFLNNYANYASHYFGSPNFDQQIVTIKEVDDVLAKTKPQPLTSIRQTIPLNGWKAYGYKNGQDAIKQKALSKWQSFKGVNIENGLLLMENALVELKIDSLFWRFKIEAKIKIDKIGSCIISLSDNYKPAIVVNLKKGELTTGSDGKTIRMGIDTKNLLKLEIEGDFTQKRFNLIVNGEQLQYYIPMADTTVTAITKLSLQSKETVQMDDFFIFNHIPVNNVYAPYFSTVVLDENFEEKPSIEGWQKIGFEDHYWEEVDLPSVHGGLREKEEDYYLRKKVTVGDFERATLMLETLDPGGEVWINGQVVAVIHNRNPVELDVTQYLKQNNENLIAVRVNPYKMRYPMVHSPSDPYIGWFLGRTSLLLSNKCMIKNVQVHTINVGDPAIQSNKIYIQYNGSGYFQGSIELNYYPWFPVDGNKIATSKREIEVKPQVENEYDIELPVKSPAYWSCNSPILYKIEVILKDKKGLPIDDYVTTTGIRTVEQKNGDFYINGVPEMLNGSQIMGLRTPIETISKNNRCVPANNVAEDLLLIKKMGANMLRMHVHAEKDTTDGINDPRYAEMADQLGIYLIWQTAGWMREGEAWNVDFDGYPKYMKQVYNHPSIVMWEASNHPNRFKTHNTFDTDNYISKIYHVISSADQSRLISPTTFWQHTHYSNYDGTLDYQGNKIQAVPEFMAELVTRGSQDAYTGYGNDWSVLRKAPNRWASSCLQAKDKAYFNFEHEESAGQPNWNLCKGQPYYLLQSYEWNYDEGSIGRKLTTLEWRASQAWQAFSAWESMKKQILLGYDGFSWCCLESGANMGTYQKPLIDSFGHPKLAYYTNKLVFQRTWAASNNVDVVYGPADMITPVINHLGDKIHVDLKIELQDINGKILYKKNLKDIELSEGNSAKQLDGFRFSKVKDGIYVIKYNLIKHTH